MCTCMYPTHDGRRDGGGHDGDKRGQRQDGWGGWGGRKGKSTGCGKEASSNNRALKFLPIPNGRRKNENARWSSRMGGTWGTYLRSVTGAGVDLSGVPRSATDAGSRRGEVSRIGSRHDRCWGRRQRERVGERESGWPIGPSSTKCSFLFCGAGTEGYLACLRGMRPSQKSWLKMH